MIKLTKIVLTFVMLAMLVPFTSQAQCTPTPLDVVMWCSNNGYDLVKYDDRVLALSWQWAEPTTGTQVEKYNVNAQSWHFGVADTLDVVYENIIFPNTVILYFEWTEQRIRVQAVDGQGRLSEWSDWSEATGNYAKLVDSGLVE